MAHEALNYVLESVNDAICFHQERDEHVFGNLVSLLRHSSFQDIRLSALPPSPQWHARFLPKCPLSFPFLSIASVNFRHWQNVKLEIVQPRFLSPDCPVPPRDTTTLIAIGAPRHALHQMIDEDSLQY